MDLRKFFDDDDEHSGSVWMADTETMADLLISDLGASAKVIGARALISVGYPLIADDLASDLKLGRSTVTRALAELVEAGWLARMEFHDPPRPPRVYWLATTPSSPEPVAGEPQPWCLADYTTVAEAEGVNATDTPPPPPERAPEPSRTPEPQRVTVASAGGSTTTTAPRSAPVAYSAPASTRRRRVKDLDDDGWYRVSGCRQRADGTWEVNSLVNVGLIVKALRHHGPEAMQEMAGQISHALSRGRRYEDLDVQQQVLIMMVLQQQREVLMTLGVVPGPSELARDAVQALAAEVSGLAV